MRVEYVLKTKTSISGFIVKTTGKAVVTNKKESLHFDVLWNTYLNFRDTIRSTHLMISHKIEMQKLQ
jgi:hypothetical protein